jgi:peptidoglycan hydrolase-like protein with peptidoglycan-binding domain
MRRWIIDGTSHLCDDHLRETGINPATRGTGGRCSAHCGRASVNRRRKMRPKFHLMAGAAGALALAMTAGVAAAQTASQSAQVQAAQQKLQAAGLYRGPADGLLDPDTRAAIARFQQQNGLQPTQQLDQQTYARLMSIPGQTPSYGSSGPVAASTTRPPAPATMRLCRALPPITTIVPAAKASGCRRLLLRTKTLPAGPARGSRPWSPRLKTPPAAEQSLKSNPSPRSEEGFAIPGTWRSPPRRIRGRALELSALPTCLGPAAAPLSTAGRGAACTRP